VHRLGAQALETALQEGVVFILSTLSGGKPDCLPQRS
jgi:hypothetical protein